MTFQSQTNTPAQASGEGLEDDYVLMDGIARRNSASFGRLYDRHSGVVFALCLRIVKDRALAEDVLVDVFQEVWSRADRYNAARGTPIAYILMLARSRALDRLRNRQSHPTTSMEQSPEVGEKAAAGSDPYQTAIDEERRSLMRHALDKLDAKYREVLECSFYDGLSHTQIALKMQKPIGTVKTYLRRGLIQLRDLVRNPEDGAGAP